MIKQLWSYRDLVTSLVRRQYQLRYRQSLGGFAWAMITPLASLAVATIVFNGVIGVESPVASVPYPVFALAALIPWTFFAQSVMAGIPSIVLSMQMVTRLPFPRAAIPVGMVGTTLIDLGISSVGFVLIAIILGNGVPITALWIPLLLFVEITLIIGVVLLGSAMNVFIRDIKMAIPLVMQLWLFLTPVVYPLETVPDSLRPLFMANPMTGIVETFREVLAYGRPPSLELLVPASIGATVLFVLGLWYFSATESRFADAI